MKKENHNTSIHHRLLQMIHGKDPDEADASSKPPESIVEEEVVVDESSAADIHIQDEHELQVPSTPTGEEVIESLTEMDEQQTTQEVYESSFPSQPETSSIGARAATTYALFASPSRFDPNSIRDKTHYLTDTLMGNLWLDVNSDGLRGSYTNSTLNAEEYDVGIGGVNVQLVHCETNEPAYIQSGEEGDTSPTAISTISRPIRGEEIITEVKTSELLEAGKSFTAGEYSFSKLDSIKRGRYYIMYQAPADYRISGNVLPLEHELINENGIEYRKCIPKGGEGDGYMNEVYEKGDLDWEGYCARSIGCFEIAPKFELKDDFTDLEQNEEDASMYEGTISNLVSLPEKNMLNVGMTGERWPLGVDQYADSEITFSFRSSVTAQDLSSVVPDDFEVSGVKQSLEDTLEALFKDTLSLAGEDGNTFDIKGVDLHAGMIHEKSSSRRTRFLRGLQGGSIGVTYTFTTRGKYNPPPSQQLGALISNSINADPVGLVKSLKDKENSLPSVFEEVDDVNIRHLTLKKVAQTKQPSTPIGISQVVYSEAPSSSGALASWAQIPVALLSILIGLLIGVLLFRRVFTRRKQVSVDPLSLYVKNGAGFALSRSIPDQSTRQSKSKRGFSVSRRRSDEENQDKRGNQDDAEVRASSEQRNRSSRNNRRRTHESNTSNDSDHQRKKKKSPNEVMAIRDID